MKVSLCFIQLKWVTWGHLWTVPYKNIILWKNILNIFIFFSDPNKNEDDTWVPDQGGPFWPVYSGTKREFLRIASNNNTRGAGMKSQECHFWSTYLPQLLRKGSLLNYSSFD